MLSVAPASLEDGKMPSSMTINDVFTFAIVADLRRLIFSVCWGAGCLVVWQKPAQLVVYVGVLSNTCCWFHAEHLLGFLLTWMF